MKNKKNIMKIWLKIFMHTKFIKIDLTFMFFPHVPTKSIHGLKGEKKIKKERRNIRVFGSVVAVAF